MHFANTPSKSFGSGHVFRLRGKENMWTDKFSYSVFLCICIITNSKWNGHSLTTTQIATISLPLSELSEKDELSYLESRGLPNSISIKRLTRGLLTSYSFNLVAFSKTGFLSLTKPRLYQPGTPSRQLQGRKKRESGFEVQALFSGFSLDTLDRRQMFGNVKGVTSMGSIATFQPISSNIN